MMEDMPTVTVSTLRRKTKELLKQAEDKPILITRYGKPAFVLMSVTQYQALSESGQPGP
jgi:prevent-host-death family protein